MPDAPGLELITGPYKLVERRPDQQYRFLSSLHVADYLPSEPRFAVHYELLNMPRVERLRVKAMLDDPGAGRTDGAAETLPEIQSCVELFPTADFHEREAYDFFGIVFRGHPDLRRILLPEDYVGWPLRRDYPVGGEPVLFTKDEPESPGWYE
jgi:NADH-quinone oxidoreductase subunit C